MNNKEIFIETALKIGERLIKNAIWDGNLCTWYVMVPDIENKKNKKAKKAQADGTIYQGTAGITLFLVELYKISPNSKLQKTIKGAINFSISEANKLANNSFGFYSGRVGIAYAVAKTAKVLNEESHLTEAIKILEPLKGNENLDKGVDVIGGAAGAIPALLQMEQIFKNNLCFDMAIALGENLISKAHMEPTGWSWGSESNSAYRNLLGYAHGAAGIGHALLELYNATNSKYFLYAAEQAFLYERQFYDKKSLNWPDFRHGELSEYIYNSEIDELTTALLNETLQSYNPQFMNAWCHGTPGIGLSRIRAYKLLNNDVYFKEAQNAIKGTIQSLINSIGANFSLCHGIGGNCEILIYYSEVLKSSLNYKIAEKYALIGFENFEKLKKPWPCGTQQTASDPSLMLGEAGIGYFYLRLYSKEVPPVLFLTNEFKNKKKFRKSYKTLQLNYINFYFGNTLENISTSVSERIKNRDFELCETISDVTKVYDSINDYINSMKDKHEKNIMRSLFKLEKRKYELSLNLNEYYKEFTNKLIKIDTNKVDWNNCIIKLTKDTEILKIIFELDKTSSRKVNFQNEDEKYFIIYRSENKFISSELAPFTFAILDLIENGNNLQNITNGIIKILENEKANIHTIKKTVKEQLEEMYRANFITIEHE